MSKELTVKKDHIAEIKKEINRQISDPDTFKSLIDTTFTNKGRPMDGALVKRALLEGMLRGFSFEDFLNRDVYAIPFGDTYSLVTSIDRSRKIGARSGIVGTDKPSYETAEDGSIVSCSVTVHKRFADGYVGAFTAEPYFAEYSTNQNLWKSKPRTMIAKVAEMHALRKACPEELAQSYVEEEMQRGEIRDAEFKEAEPKKVPIELIAEWRIKLEKCKNKEELTTTWADCPADVKPSLRGAMEEALAMVQSEEAVIN